MTIWKSANNQAYFDCDITPINSQVPINFYQHYGSNIGAWATACYNCASWEMSIYTSSISYSVLFIWDSMPNTFTQNGNDARSYIKHDTDTDKYIVYMGGGYGYTASEPVSEFPNWRIAYPDTAVPQAFKDYVNTPIITGIWSNGGGATHIAKVTGQLSSLSNNLSDILMVSGGGGGGLIIGEDTYAGKDAGGISGSGNNSANQTT